MSGADGDDTLVRRDVARGLLGARKSLPAYLFYDAEGSRLYELITELPAVLSRRLDPRTAFALVWGEVHAGQAANVIPSSGTVAGTLRMLDATAWTTIGPVLEEAVGHVVAPYAVTAVLEHVQGVPPVVNDPDAIEVLRQAADGCGMAGRVGSGRGRARENRRQAVVLGVRACHR